MGMIAPPILFPASSSEMDVLLRTKAVCFGKSLLNTLSRMFRTAVRFFTPSSPMAIAAVESRYACPSP